MSLLRWQQYKPMFRHEPREVRWPWPDEAHAVAERDHWIRLFNRLEAAVSHHRKADRFKDDHDEALYAARARILKDAARPLNEGSEATPS